MNNLNTLKHDFFRLLEYKSGDVKPLIMEQPESVMDRRFGINVNKEITPKKDVIKNLNPKNLKLGDGGTKSPEKKQDVINLQNELIKLGCLTTKTGKATGYFGNLTDLALKKYQKNGRCVNGLIDNKQKSESTVNFSNQVLNQIKYLNSKKILINDKFTIVDDINNKVHAFNPGYKLFKTYNVITGKDMGDKLKTKTMRDWIFENWKTIFSRIWSNPFEDIAEYVDKCYFNQDEWLIRNTPSGVFKRAGLVENFMNDWLATLFISEDYGKRFITWKTCDGSTIPFGFHGTENKVRLQVLEDKNIDNQSCKKRNMSYGCINFKESDVIEISNFIDSGQISIWLPDSTNDIVEVPSNCL